MNDWEKHKLEAITERICVGYVGSCQKDYTEKGNGVMMIRTTNLNLFKLDLSAVQYISKEFHDRNKKSQLKKNDILIARHGDNGKASMYELEAEANCLNVVIIRPDEAKANSKFLLYLINSPATRELILSQSTGSVQDVINTRAIAGLELPIPDLPTQTRIASILSALDDKIELNRRTNHTLEQMAQTLFKKYFVTDIDPDNLPKGWRKEPISSVAERIQYGFTQSASVKAIGPKFLRITDIQEGKINWDEVPYCEANNADFEKYKIMKHDIFIARTGASTGENIHVLNPPNAVFASYLIRVQFKNPMLATYVGKFLRQNVYFDYVASILGGSAQPNANAQELTGIEIIIPSDDALKKYFLTVDLINHKKENNEKENLMLSKLRDTLLPKLMSGEINVN
ncbi:restriction endonuclease subunit S [Lacibacter sp.]|uniref:restriction endonuclease subunit S n=1 Tax=Lacibacter sp. TaxID=1915409 RepID=UPI002B4AB495|nr:restriction endonuclease subunit S [Lacibacter sp.]HLP35961.1 restriction endonuclease subunit S [Lacibacter sp.]